jgi:uncharacterized membrane protein HdeD (DUF308 family)
MSMSDATALDEAGLIREIAKHWGILFTFGVISVLLGIASLVWTAAVTVAIAFLFVAWLIIAGIYEIVKAFTVHRVSGWIRALYIITGVLSILMAFLALTFGGLNESTTTAPHVTNAAIGSAYLFAIFIGFAWFFSGVMGLIGAIEAKGAPGRGWAIAGSILSIVAGLILVFSPHTILVVVWVGGIFLLIYGIGEIVQSLRLRKLAAS